MLQVTDDLILVKFGNAVSKDTFIFMVTNFKVCLSCCWAEAPIKIARMTLTIKLDGNWSSFQLANSAPPLSVTDSALAPSARMPWCAAEPRCSTHPMGTYLRFRNSAAARSREGEEMHKQCHDAPKPLKAHWLGARTPAKI